jgi:hypothetical protein
MARLHPLLPTAAIVICASFIGAEAYADTGAVRGEVTDQSGLPVPGAVVTLSGPNLGGDISVTTDAEGHFRVPTVPPGTHAVLITKDGFAPVKLAVTVRLDETARVPVALTMSEAGAEIIIEETLPVIDSTRSAFSTSMDAELLQNLPVGRSYQSAVNMLPGISGRVDTQSGGPGNGNPSVRGEGQYGNNYMVDGLVTRDPATKTFGAGVNFDAIQEIQVYTDGVPAEFSQATGMFVNVVTKDGADQHFGTAGYWINFDADPGTYMILDVAQGEEVETKKRNFTNHELALTAGGPLVQEKLWYMVALTGTASDIEYESLKGLPYISKGLSGIGKLTWFAAPDITLQYQLNASGSDIDNYETSGLYAEEAQAQYNSKNLGHTFTARFTPSSTSAVELKLGVNNSNIDVQPMSGSEDEPQILDVNQGLYLNNYDSFDINTRGRLGGSLKVTQLVDGLLGDHRFKVGGEAWRVSDSRDLLFTGPGDGYQYLRDTDGGFPCTAEANYEDCLGYTQYTDVGDPLGHVGFVGGAFVQDDWQPVDRLTLNLGMRLDGEVLYADQAQAATKVYSAIMPAPRTGLAWDITGDSKNVMTVNYGRYYDVSGTDFAAWGDDRSSFSYSEYRANGDGGYDLVWVQDPAANPLIFCDESLWDKPEDAAVAEIYKTACNGESLKPYHNDKAIVAYSREILPLFSVSVRGILSRTSDLPEDIDHDLDYWVITNPANKYRDYRALELVAQRRYDGKWQMVASYTLSEAKGHMPGQFELSSGGQSGSDGNNVGVYGDDVSDPAARQSFFEGGYGWLLDGLAGLGSANDSAGYYGYLPYHSFHAVKLNGSYTFAWGTTLGAVYEFDSGHAWQRKGYVDLYGDYYAMDEGRGTRFMPATHYVDIRVAHAFSFSETKNLEITADIFNLPGFEAPVTYMENDIDSFGLTLYRQAPRSVRLGMRYTF